MEEESQKRDERQESYAIPPTSRTPDSLTVISGSRSTRLSSGEIELIYGARHVILLFVPVAICMAIVVLTISSVQYYSIDDGNYLIYTPFHPKPTDTKKDTIVKSTLNALIVLLVVVVMTFLLILLYKLRCYKVMHVWILLSSLMLLFIFSFVYLQELLKAFNIAADLITVTILLYNFGISGMLMIHWRGPLLLQQAYLIISAALMSLVFIKYMPEWTLWSVLAVLAIWDLVAVLAPHGPLKMLIETAEERGEAVMPALIYSSTVMYSVLAANEGEPSSKDSGQPDSSKQSGAGVKGADAVIEDDKSAKLSSAQVELQEGDTEPGAVDNSEPEAEVAIPQAGPGSTQIQERPALRGESNQEERGVKLGLGDFIFYSVLVGKASSSGDPAVTISCFIAILMGLFLTLAILVTVKKALPALPISIMLGLLFNFGTGYIISPMIRQFSANQIFL